MRTIALILVCAILTISIGAMAQDKAPGHPDQLTAFYSEFDSLLTPTNEWINVYCDGPTLDGEPLMPGDTIMAYDPDGVLCGVDTVRADGKYGFLPIYRDDPFSEEDEGAMPGDTIQFAINSTMVDSDPVIVWTENGDGFELCAFMSLDVDVYVDIKPGSCPNPFNTRGNLQRGKSVLPVAVLGGEDFDVMDIDPSTITLAGVPAIRHSYEDVATPFDREEGSCECHDERKDGYEDLTLKFLRWEILQALGSVTDREYVTLELTGQLYDGTEITGSDCIWILGDYEADGDGETVLRPGNHPNPFNPTTTIQFTMPVSGTYAVEVFDVRGRQVASFTGTEGAGPVAVHFDATKLSSGIYLYRISVDQWQETRKMLLLK